MGRIECHFLEIVAHALPIYTPLTLSFIRADELYQCETRVVGPVKAGTLTVARPRVITRVQRRQFYRLPLHSPTHQPFDG